MDPSQPTCPECGRTFDLFKDQDANEWYYGHDCDPQTPYKPILSILETKPIQLEK